jgi:O-antigen ligase
VPILDHAALAAILLLPVFLMHAKAVAEGVVGLVGVAFLVRSAGRGDWSWLRQGWVPIGIAWWLWLVLCSTPAIGIGGWHSLGQALAAVRFLVLTAALEHWLLETARARRWLSWSLTAAALYIGINALGQLAAGRNMWGLPRYADGALSGPFAKPRAGAPMSRLLFPALLPPVARLLAHRQAGASIAAFALTAAGVGTVVLIGQRMPLMLTVLGLVVAGLMLPRLRLVVLASVVAGAALLGASAVVSPPTWYRLVTKFGAQMESFPDSDYGLIAARAVVIAADNPVFGRGFDGFRNACPDPQTWQAWSAVRSHPDGGGGAICNIHPHNHYLQAATDSGVPGLALFCALAVAWLRGMLRHLGPDPDPLRVGLFVGVLMELWPIASTSGFYATELSGFMFLMLGLGLAAARAPRV